MTETEASCRCGACRMVLTGPPIQVVSCHCTSCRAAADRVAALPGAMPETDGHGGTPFVMQRKDRLQVTAGADTLASFRLGPAAKTRRAIATCCNSMMFLDLPGGHWLSIPLARLPQGAGQRPTLRTMTRDDPAADRLPDDIRNARTHTVGFMWRLLAAYVAMGFRVPKLNLAEKELPDV